ncbi:hypothetical protein BGZ54_000909 [Gamsiella multidivaricata]|nr:hypothetical protein BGZ54_000909 [Gamsiella multidivaricata]
MAGQLSGGMKRRLSIIVSTIGDPDVLILDEPTTGMNPAHRRYVWASLAQFKHGRSILLTAYSMEEADALSDKGAILIAGHLKAIGNTTRLKNEFRNGYRVEIALGVNAPATQVSSSPHMAQGNSAIQAARAPSADASHWQEMSAAIRQTMPESTLLDQSGSAMVFGISMLATDRMGDLTAMLEESQAQGLIKHWRSTS